MKFLLYCAKCKHKMQYESRTPGLKGKKKKCVYCGKQIVIEKGIVNNI